MKNYDITITITQRCNARCQMCNLWDNPTNPENEISLEELEKLPQCKLLKITGGEPFVRADIRDVAAVLHKKTKRLLINTNGYYTEKIVALGKEFPDVAFRISIDGSKEIHNKIRGIDIYDKAIATLEGLKKVGARDVGISFVLQENNVEELIKTYHKALELNVDFGCSTVRNSFYFCKDDNNIHDAGMDRMEEELRLLIKEQLRSKRKKDWARAFVNDYTIRFMRGQELSILCDAGETSFFIDVDGNVLPCNMTPKPLVMGNIKNQTWDEIITSERARKVVTYCKNCKTPCWFICNVQTEIKKKIWIPAWWLVKNKVMGR